MYKENIKLDIEYFIDKYHLNCTAEEFKDKADWNNISKCDALSKDFVEEFILQLNYHNTVADGNIFKPFYIEAARKAKLKETKTEIIQKIECNNPIQFIEI